MALIRPRLTDHFGIHLPQEAVDFVIPFFDEDIPLYLDPFLLWIAPTQPERSLHTLIINSFKQIVHLYRSGKADEAIRALIQASECNEVGLGFSPSRRGRRIGEETARSILDLFDRIPQINEDGFTHFEEIQLLVDNFSKDRVSDISANFLLPTLIDFSMMQCEKYGIPTQDTTISALFDERKVQFERDVKAKLPVNPETGKPIVLVPKHWLRVIPWINFDDYVDNYYRVEFLRPEEKTPSRVSILNFNRGNYDAVQGYVKLKERVRSQCKFDPTFQFEFLPLRSLKRKFDSILRLPTGKDDQVDRKYEDTMGQLMANMLYPQLDYAKARSRTDSGTLIRDLVFYNTQSTAFLKEIYEKYKSVQIVVEMKNVRAIHSEHINQLHRYLGDNFGRFGVLLTRHKLDSAMERNLIDLWSGSRTCIIALTDQDVDFMVALCHSQASTKRPPIAGLESKYVEFMRRCPS